MSSDSLTTLILPTVLEKDFTYGADLQVVECRLETDSPHCVTWLCHCSKASTYNWFDSYSIYRLLKGLSFTAVGRFHLAKGACCTFSAVSVMSQTFCSTGHIDFFSDVASNSQLEVQLHNERHEQWRHQKMIKHWNRMKEPRVQQWWIECVFTHMRSSVCVELGCRR